MSLKSNLLSRIGKKGEEAAAAEAIEIAVLKNAASWNAEVANMEVELMQAKSALRSADSAAHVSGSDYVELQREVTAIEQDLKALRIAYTARFADNSTEA